MVEWHVTPDYIENNWTDELFNLMMEKLVERKQRHLKEISKTSGNVGKVPEVELFRRAGKLIKVDKK